ncbi:hypothetical protein [Bifidobacterium sp. SO4]|uniref:hypothetical protein n=1 Tax=Bifidobacterium sp. SO4 TaxID=2809030 RepID=UPI001BDC5939|nr:hypothetical protein [Bifidobacterium sp. SO4]MBT1170597.1 hypothetical protein [Bifidobacterium sp. SO4]
MINHHLKVILVITGWLPDTVQIENEGSSWMRRLGKIATLLAAVGMLFTGGAVANADEGDISMPQDATQASPSVAAEADIKRFTAVKITDVKIEDVGAHSAGLKVGYTVDPSYKDQIKSICPIAYLWDYSSITWNNPKNVPFNGASSGFGWSGKCEGISDPDVTQADYERLFGEHTTNIPLDNGVDGVSFDVTGHSWTRFYPDAWDTEKRPTSGTFSMTLLGLEPNHFYGNRNIQHPTSEAVDNLVDWAYDNPGQSGKTTAVDMHGLTVGAYVEYTDGTNNVDSMRDYGNVGPGSIAVEIPGFTTTAEPKAPGEVDVLGSSKNDVTPQSGNAKQDSVYRLYVKNLSEVCKAQLDANASDPCIWYGYIYSTPTALIDPSGAPYLEVLKDEKATDSAKQYYVDVYIPKTVANGDHKIALTDSEGKLQGWTPVTVGEASPAEQTAEKLYDEWGDPIVDTTLQAGRGELTDPKSYTEDSLKAYKTAFAAFAKKVSGVQKDALNSTDKAAGVALLAKQENLNDLYNELHNAHEKLVKYVTVYRLFNPYERRAGSHHYTASEQERQNLIAAGWRDEGKAFVTTSKGEPVYRAYNPHDGSHFYTLDKDEFNNAVNDGWHDEGIGFYASNDAKVLLYRLYNPHSGEHFYTTDKQEADNDVKAGWRDEGTAWNVIE